MGRKVTVVIPVHNHARWVGRAIESVVLQTHSERSVVVVDDGSSDGSCEAAIDCLKTVYEATTLSDQGRGEAVWAGSLRDRTEALVIRHAKAGGPSAARNRGILAAMSGGADYIALLDSDDEYHPDKLAKSVSAFEAYPPGVVGAVYSDYETVAPDGRRIREFKPPFSRERLLRECIVNCDSVVSRQAAEAVGKFDESLRVCEDYDYWLRLSEQFAIIHLPESLVTIRVGGHSSTATIASQTWNRCHARVFAKLNERAAAQESARV